MPQAGDSYTVVLKEAHLNWGTHRYTYTRDRIYGEAYIQIPLGVARSIGILRGAVFNCTSTDGQFNHPLRAAGCCTAGAIHAKQFQGDGDLKVLGTWLHGYCGANVGDRIEVTWTSPNDIVLRYIP
ncbi:hypothetical protein [Clostridium peptidivorans]|uniref:hypothetical protein n=1 Tax=Clostridium peptidivorans TaxID=100174 RepID=UPI000BE41956|nr:hypothetical protein [Clostridium peptidivorans]